MKNIDWSKNRWDTVGENSILGVEPPRNRGKVRPTPGIAQKYKFEQENEAFMKDLSEPTPQNNPQTTNNSASDEGGNSGDTLGAALAMLGAVIQTSKSIGKTHERNNENQTKGLAMLDEAQKEIEKLRQSLQGGGEQVPFRALKMRYEKPAPKPKWEVIDWGRNVWDSENKSLQEEKTAKSSLSPCKKYYDGNGNAITLPEGMAPTSPKLILDEGIIAKIKRGEMLTDEDKRYIIDIPTQQEIDIMKELYKKTENSRKGGIAAFGSEHGTVVYSEPFSDDKVFSQTRIVEGTNSVISAEDMSAIYAEVPIRIIPIPNTQPHKEAKYKSRYVYDIHTHDIFWKLIEGTTNKYKILGSGASPTDIDNYPLANTRPNVVLSFDFTLDDTELSSDLGSRDNRKLKTDFFQEMRKKVYYYDNRSNIGDGVSFSILVSF